MGVCLGIHIQTCMHMRDMHLLRRGICDGLSMYIELVTGINQVWLNWRKPDHCKKKEITGRISPTLNESWFYVTTKFLFSFKNLKVHVVFKTSSLFLKCKSTNIIWFFITYSLLRFLSPSWVRVYKYFMRTLFI